MVRSRRRRLHLPGFYQRARARRRASLLQAFYRLERLSRDPNERNAQPHRRGDAVQRRQHPPHQPPDEPIILQHENRLRGSKFGGCDLRIHYTYDPIRNRRQFAGPADMAEFAHWLTAALPAIQAAAEQKFIEKADAMIIDSMILPYEDWRELYMQER